MADLWYTCVSWAAEDVAVVSNSECFGVIHGDLNVSNFFYTPPAGDAGASLSVFDWDQVCMTSVARVHAAVHSGRDLQVQRGWFMWDLAQPLVGALMLHEVLVLHWICRRGDSCDGCAYRAARS